jgi:hypothetical protein
LLAVIPWHVLAHVGFADGQNRAMTSESAKRPVFMLSTAGKTREQMKAEARRALAEVLSAQPDDSEADS